MKAVALQFNENKLVTFAWTTDKGQTKEHRVLSSTDFNIHSKQLLTKLMLSAVAKHCYRHQIPVSMVFLLEEVDSAFLETVSPKIIVLENEGLSSGLIFEQHQGTLSFESLIPRKYSNIHNSVIFDIETEINRRSVELWKAARTLNK